MHRQESIKHEGLVSWLKYFDVNYLPNDLAEEMSQLDVNDPTDQSEAIRAAVLPDFETWNDVSRSSMRNILELALVATDEELEPAFFRIGMPFHSEINNRAAFLLNVWAHAFPGERPNNSFKPRPLRGSA